MRETMNKYEWKSVSDKYYYYNVDTGKIVATAGKVALQEIFFSVTYTGNITFRLDDEHHLGQYISLEYAKRAAETYWDIQNRTLLEQ
ncbi:MAG: hypothetical protein RL463_1009 [Bacteroidota bacterium]